MSGAELVFWLAAALLAYTYVGYPAIAVWIARKQPLRAGIAAPEFQPGVAVLIAAYNEQAHIAERIANVLAQDYPPDRLHAVIGSDGSTDDTARIARRLAGARAHVHAFETNRGKASVLNDLVARTSQDVIIFSDANTRFEKDTVAKLVAPLADPAIGAVCGELILTPPDGSRNEDHRYWTLERRLKAAESTFDGLLGANGGVYAIRRSSYRPLTPDTICDDFVIVMNVAVAGLGVIYEPLARAYEETPHDMRTEFRRRVRIGIGNYQSLFRHPEFLTSTGCARKVDIRVAQGAALVDAAPARRRTGGVVRGPAAAGIRSASCRAACSLRGCLPRLRHRKVNRVARAAEVSHTLPRGQRRVWHRFCPLPVRWRFRPLGANGAMTRGRSLRVTNDWDVRARRFLRRTWMKYALKGVAGADAHDRLDRAYAMEDPWNLDSEMERARFEWTNRIVAERFGALESILEIGCGEGHQTLHLQKLCRDIYGVDVSARAIERARRRVPGAQLAVADVFGHPWNERRERFDLVTACEIIYYVSDMDAMLARMSQIGRHCLVTVFAPAAPRVSTALTRYIGDRRDWFCFGHTVWLAGWWSNE